MRRPARTFTLGVALLGAACAGHGISLGPASRPADPALLLSCARSVAAERGLGEITQPTGALEIQAKSAVTVPSAGAERSAASYDLLTVKLAQAKNGFRMLVGSASFALKKLTSGGVGTSAAKSEWVGTEPSERVALARDAVLQQCGTVGN